MANWRAAFPSSYLKAADVESPRLLTIKSTKTEELNGEPKLVVHFREVETGLVLNRINGDSIERVAGSPDTDRWPGVAVVLYASETDFQGKRVPCIRIRAPKAGKAAPAPVPQPPAEEDDDVPF